MTMSLVRTALVALLLAGCGASGDEKPELGAPPVFPVPGCEHIDHHPCDIRTSRCQERLMQLAACLRGSEPLPVPTITTMTEEEFAAYLNARFAEDPPPEPNPYEIALGMLNLVQPGGLGQEALVASDVEFVWGVYRRAEKDVLMVDHGVPADDADPNSVLVHEFVHAMQDSDVDLQAFFDEFSTSYDSDLAAASVSEGEARFHQTRFWSSLLGLDPANIDWNEHFQSIAKYAEQDVLAAPSPYVATWSSFPYHFGARLVNHAWLESGPAGVDELFASPPTRTLDLMLSVSDIARTDWPAPEFSPIEPPDPWTLFTETSLGAWGLYLRFSRVLDAAYAHTLALELRGDHLGVYVSGATPAETAVVWQLEFSSEGFATQLETRVQNMSGSVLRSGNRVVLARSTGTTPLDWALVP
jgi:hypothetical protein